MRCSATLGRRGGSSMVVTCLLRRKVSLPSHMKSRDYFACWCSSTKPESLQKQGWWDRPASSSFGCWTRQRHQQLSPSCRICCDVSQLDLPPPCKGNRHKHPWGRRQQVSKALHGRDNARQKSNTPEGLLAVHCFHWKMEDYFLLS